jgi:uncharacterized protein YfaS (alpha-2-macroglobulin family)
MRHIRLISLLFFVISCSFIFCEKTGAQHLYNNIVFKIDSLGNAGLPKSALAEVEKLDQLARKDNNSSQIIKAALYRITFQNYMEEDALVTVINTLRKDISRSDYPAKPVMQSLLARMYWQYYQQNSYNLADRSKVTQRDDDFRKWDLSALINETSSLYDQSLTDAVKEQNTPLTVLNDVLTGDNKTRGLRPTLYDLLLHRAFEFFLASEPAVNKPRLPFSLNDKRFFSDSKTFAALNVSTTDSASTLYHGVKYLQQATAFHLQKNNGEALADLTLIRLKFLFEHAGLENTDSLYLAGLETIAADNTAKTIRSDALVELALYYRERDSLTKAMAYLQKAIAIDTDSFGAKNARVLIKQISQKELDGVVETVNAPGVPILARLGYSNVSTAAFRLYRLTDKQQGQLIKLKNVRNTLGANNAALKYIATLKAVQDTLFNLPAYTDYRKHYAEFKIAPLTPGNYFLVIKSDSLVQTGQFAVSRLAYMLRSIPGGHKEIRVTDRETGRPLKGIHITLKPNSEVYNKAEKKKMIPVQGITDANGKFMFMTKAYSFGITLKTNDDELLIPDEYTPTQREANRDDDDNAPVKTILFTDRQLYRPGQTVYFKALQIQKFNGKSNVIANQDLLVIFKDPNLKQFGSVKLKTNEFGSAASSFIIPQKILNGTVHIETSTGNVSVSVEEYKRPSFKVAFMPVAKAYKLNDSVTINGNAKAFSGYGLAGVRVAYHVSRTLFRNINDDFATRRRYIHNNRNNEAEISADTITTDAQGDFSIKFLASADDKPNSNDRYMFDISADITDSNNETQSASTVFNLSNSPLKLDADVPENIFSQKPVKCSATLTNLNGEPQTGKLNIRITALKSPGFFKERKWEKPDQFFMSKADFKKHFPFFAYGDEDEVENWEALKTVSETNISLKGKNNPVDMSGLLKSGSGMYKITFSAKNDDGDTVSTIRYVNYIAQPAPAQKEWIIPVAVKIARGDSARFVLGINKSGTFLLETYDGARLLSSQYLPLGANVQKQLSIAVPASVKSFFDVQVIMINGNRSYKHLQRIDIVDSTKNLNVKFLTFRNRLQPGQKEQWKLQITGTDEKQSAELLAAMYDASLDNLAPSREWSLGYPVYRPFKPFYFEWEDNGISEYTSTDEYSVIPSFGYYSAQSEKKRQYEELQTFDFDYNRYNQNNLTKLLTASNRQLAARYIKNAALVKNGFDFVGRAVGYEGGLGGVRVSISTTKISTTTNTLGYFRIKVPQGIAVIFSRKDLVTVKILPVKGLKTTVRLQETPIKTEYELMTADPGQKDQKGDPNAEIRVDEPVGNSDVMQLVEGNAVKRFNGDMVIFPPPVYKSSDERLHFNYTIDKVMREIPVTIRKNFGETAFFYPQLHTDEKGQVLIDFTMPESLTTWKFRGFAHTRDLKTGYMDEEVISQKQLMVSANTPRFLREGDTLTITAKVVNLTAQKLKAKVQLQLFNALNMQPVQLLTNSKMAGQDISIGEGGSNVIAYKLIVAAGIDALTYRVTAIAGDHSDGEENTIPVLPNSMPVTETMPIMVRAGQTKTFMFDKLMNNNSATISNKTLTFEYTQYPVWSAIQSLPYLMEFPYECSEQTFSRYYANSFALAIVNRYPQVKQVFDQWKNVDSKTLLSNLENNAALKTVLLEETPWLQDAANETEPKNRIAALFDLNRMSHELEENLLKLLKKQLPSGGFPWFGGEYADRYITQHILAGIGQLNKLNNGVKSDVVLNKISGNALFYVDKQLKDEELEARKVNKKYRERPITSLEIHAWYARSYFKDAKVDADLVPVLTGYLNRAAAQWLSQSEYERGLIALTLYRYNKKEEAGAITKSLLETAQQTTELGMYWAKNQPGYYWYQAPIETQALMIELFTETAGSLKAIEEMKIWLLSNKQTNNWRTTKATAAACYALLLKTDALPVGTAATAITIGDKPLAQLKPAIKAEAGTGYIKTNWIDEQIKPALGKVIITNSSKTINWGAMYWQYTEKLDKITSSNTNVQLQRKYFIVKQTAAGEVLTLVDAKHLPQTGDVLKVVVYVTADRDFDYIHIKDMRPSGTEPADVLSTFKYQDGLYYYQETKDVATNFFISQLKKGNYVFEYKLRVVQPGNYATGIISLQSMYAPGFSAHSAGGRITVK